jgi:hypothetical protein
LLWSRNGGRVLVGTLIPIVLLLGGCGDTSPSSGTVLDHVHAAVPGSSGSVVYLATHYGLVRSNDGGRSWIQDPGLGDEMVGGLVKTGNSYVAALQPTGPGMKMTRGQASMPGMSMGSASTPNIGFSNDGTHWYSAVGIPDAASVASLVAGPNSSTVWASLLGRGIYESTNDGHHWNEVIPSTSPITELEVVGQSLLIATSSGVFVTDTTDPSMPALPQLNNPVNDVVPLEGCSTCAAVALSTGGVALSDDDGVTWVQHASAHVFDELASVAGTPTVLFGMDPAPADRGRGLWRSTDEGRTWLRVLDHPLIDHLYQVPGTATQPGYLLAFEWGITVYRSNNVGATWFRLSRVKQQ